MKKAPAVVLLCSVLPAFGCDGNNRVAARVACYPGCLARIVEHCPMLSMCNSELEANPNIPNPDVRSGTATCFASGERKWVATNAVTNGNYIVVKHADDSECFTAVSQGATPQLYAISVGGQTVAELDVQSTTSPPTITCSGGTGEIVVTDSCFSLPWTDTMTCEQAICDFGVLPPGAATGTAN